MKKISFFVIVMAVFLSGYFNAWAQITAAGDIAFTAFNSDGQKDFSIVALVDISSNTIVYFSDNNWDGASAFVNTEGALRWDSGATIIKAGTIIIFTDVKTDANPYYGSSIGTLTTPNAGFNPVEGGDTVLAFLGTDDLSPTTFLAGYRNKTLVSGELTGTGLTAGTNFLEINQTASPNGGYYSGYRSNQTLFSSYLALIYDKLNWTRNTSDGEATLPISTTGFTISTTTWTGTSDTDWTVSGNWNNGVPDNSFQVLIPNVTNKPIISSGTTHIIGNLTIDASSSLTINAGKGLTVSGNLVNNGTFTVASDASTSGSLIVTGTSTGNVTYNRYMTGVDKWHLIAAPVGAQDIQGFVEAGANNIATSSDNYSVTPYDNNGTAWGTHWTTVVSGKANSVSGAGNFLAAKGYEILTTTDGTVAFTGTVPVAAVAIAITQGTANSWNVVGNPFPSSIPANTNADATNNFITVNAAALHTSYQALYFWNPVTPGYDIINQSTVAATHIAPGQAFFVNSIDGGSTVNFTAAMRSHQSAVAFQKAATTATPSITLIADDNAGKISTTTIKYMGGMSLGLDPGYDAGRFSGTASNFGIYSKLVTDNGVDFALQVVPENSYDTTVIPIGLDATIGTQITFKADYTNLPVGKKVFLEDHLLGSFTEINNSDITYTLTLSSASSGFGRFFLHTQDNASTLGIDNVVKSKFTLVASPNTNSIKVFGLIEQSASLDIYDSLGRKIYTSKLQGGTTNNIQVPSMATGVYFVKIKSASSNFNQKIFWY